MCRMNAGRKQEVESSDVTRQGTEGAPWPGPKNGKKANKNC